MTFPCRTVQFILASRTLLDFITLFVIGYAKGVISRTFELIFEAFIIIAVVFITPIPTIIGVVANLCWVEAMPV